MKKFFGKIKLPKFKWWVWVVMVLALAYIINGIVYATMIYKTYPDSLDAGEEYPDQNESTMFMTKIYPFVAAWVNYRPLSAQEYYKQLSYVRHFAEKTQQVMPSNSELQKQVIDQMVDTELMRQQAAKYDIKVTSDEIEDTFLEIVFEQEPEVKTMKDELDELKAGQESFENQENYDIDTMKETASTLGISEEEYANMDEDKLKNKIISTYKTQIREKEDKYEDSLEQAEKSVDDILSELYGMTRSEFKQLIKDQLIRQKIQEDLFVQVKASHILISDEEKAKEILTKVNEEGADFAEIAKEYSEDTGSRDSGGELGWFGRGMMVAEFEDAVFAMQPGEISQELVQTEFGYHIIKVEERQGKIDQAYLDWFTQLEEGSSIYIWIDTSASDAEENNVISPDDTITEEEKTTDESVDDAVDESSEENTEESSE